MTRRVLGTAVAVCLIGVGVLFVPAALVVRSRERTVDFLELQRRAANAARRLPADPAGVARLPDLGDDESDHVYAVYGPSGELIAGTGPGSGDRVVSAALGGSDARAIVGGDLVVAVPLGPAARTTGVIRVAEPLAESVRRARATIIRLAVAAAAAVAVAGAAGWWLVRRLLRPVRRLREAAHGLGDGDFTVAVEPSGLPEIDEVGRDLVAAGQRIGCLVERERAFSADASHQLRTPIAALRVALEGELLAPRPDPRLIIEESLAAVDRLDATVADLLRLARDAPADRGTVDLDDLAARLAGRWRPPLQRAGRTLRVMVQPTPGVRASASAVTHVLDVLLDNACRHGTGTVTLAAGPAPGGASVTVTNEGPAIGDPGSLFQRRSAGPAGPATGIGLALARTLAEAEGGRLRLRTSDPPTFELLFSAELGGDAPPA